ncbi:protein of unknown function (DUF1790) [Cylindrospermum stagnale PCC 7417]|uniref:YbjN domain-containing protein n=1 Tax=Cylindrospermum stagnale PCC 7417 TaxID=56107 RepID=K9WYE2_9NOST|nr:YbjN domain-containing protein [Cylindrospermum stagnale]AFZ24527.1 protein of unknown function (DUF1790) [Cylindrospermum stagnale PCC 7417]
MTTYTQNHQLNTELTLQDSEQSPLTVQAKTLTLTTQNDILIESRLTFHVNPELYQRIHTQGLFNLQPELRGSLTNGEFDSETNIAITASLKPDLLPHLTPHLDNAPAYLQKLSQENPSNPLLSTESWLGLQVNQQRLPIATGYSTFWDYVNFTAISGENLDSEQISKGVSNFFENWAEANLEPIANDAISQVLSEVTQGLEEWIDSSISAITSETLTQAFSEIAKAFEKLVEPSEFDTNQQNIASQNIFAAMVDFFKIDDWTCIKIEGEAALQMAFSGKNGVCNCYAKAKEIEQQFVFYSICPVIAPKSKHQAIAEFIARANHDMIIGNFELDFNSGEIRYKTSINVEDGKLSFNCIKILVYTNVKMMDKYLAGILSVINDNVSPMSAIKQIELMQDVSQSSDEIVQSLVVAPTDKPEELVVNSTLQLEIQPQEEKIPERQSHILARLTPDEIGKLHQALQMLEPYQRKQTQAILEKVKGLIIARLGNLGTEVFDEAFTFFTKTKFPGIILKLTQRYSRMAGQTKLFIQQLKDWIKQYGEAADNSDINLAIEDLEKLFGRINKRLEELPTDKLLGEKELIYLLEIEQFREQLAFFDKFIKNLPEKPPDGLAST